MEKRLRGIDAVTLDAEDLEDRDRVQLRIRSGTFAATYDLTHERDAWALAELESHCLTARLLLDPDARVDRQDSDPYDPELAIGRRAVLLLGILVQQGAQWWEYMEPEVLQVLASAGSCGLLDPTKSIADQFGDYYMARLAERRLQDEGRDEPDPEEVRHA